MLDYTYAAIEKIKSDLKKSFLAFDIFTQIVYIAYLIYAIFAGVGNFTVNVVLCAISICYFAFYLFSYKKISRDKSQTARRCYRWIKIIASAFAAGIAFYGVYATTSNVTATAVILVSLMVVLWVLRVVLEVFICFFESEANLIIEGVKADKENAVKPIKTVSNTIKKIVGEEIEPEPKPNKYRKILDKRVEEKRSERREEKKEKVKKILFTVKKTIMKEKDEGDREKDREESFK